MKSREGGRAGGALIKVEGLVHVYGLEREGGRRALDGVDLEVAAGEFLALVGPNGSGKSTLVRHFNALLMPTEGRVTVAGLDTSCPENVPAVRRLVGMVFQNPENQIVGSLVEEEVAFGPENLGLSPGEVRCRVDRALAVTGLSALKDRPPHLLSGGQKQLLAVAGSLAVEPAVLVLDEPLSMLDPVRRREIFEFLRSLNQREGVTVVVTTHSMEEAAAAGRVAVMAGGRVVADGPPAEVFARESLLAGLGLEVPAAFKIAGDLRRRGLPLSPGITCEEELAGELISLWRARQGASEG